jgi:hypothetical protein
MAWLSSLSPWVLLTGWLAVALLVAAAGRAIAAALVPRDELGDVRGVAGPLMPALGATFAVLTAITLSSEAGYLKSAQDIVSAEGASAARLAWAATSPATDGAPIQRALLDYLETTRRQEWDGDRVARGDDAATEAAIARLERVVRAEAARPEIGTPSSTELLSALDAVTGGRRARVAAAARDLPLLYVITLVASGLALIANAGVLVVASGRRSALFVIGLAVVVGLSLALLFSLTAPWRGGLVVSGKPIDAVVVDLQTGFFTR